ncbi:MAG: AMP-binding protein [Betaproteobacteria bacterium]|nr:AMP-binding protein [Betaproteobacteria bacterium]
MQPQQPARDVVERLLGVVSALVAETHPGRVRPAGIASHFERDLGLDSLARVELMLRLGQEFGAPLAEAALAEAETPRDLLRFIGQAGVTHSVPEAAGTVPSAMPPTATPERAGTLVEALEWHARHNPGRTHVLLYGEGDEAQAISYADLLLESRRIAAGLVTHGLLPRQAVALMLPTGRAYLSCFFGVMLAGGIPVPIYPPARLAQLEDHLRRHARILGNAEAVFIITVPQAKGVAALLRKEAPSLAEVLTPDELAVAPMELLYRATPEDIAFLQYTSGSTGDPKGVMLSHANLLANLRAMGGAIEVGGEDVFVSWLPLYHDMGLIGAWFGSLYFAMPLVLMSPLAFLSRPARWLEAISRHRGTISAAPNFAYELCANRLGDAELQGLDLSCWRLALNGAEPVSPATLAAFAARFSPFGLPGAAITPVYGLAECSVGLAFPPLGRGPRVDRIRRAALAGERAALPAGESETDAVRVPACGRAIAGHEIRIVDEAGCELVDRRVGRLQFRGPSATAGYFRNPDATKRLFSDGWLDSGDFAYSVDGEIYLTGRVKDLIIRGGRNLYPYELEQAVGCLPGIRKGCVAVFACSDAGGTGERLVVLAETRAEEAGARDALRQRINEVAVETMGVPADEIVLAPPNSVLKTSSGKIRRNASRDAYQNGLIGAKTATDRWQMWRLGAVAQQARFAELARRAAGTAYAGWCWAVFVALALPVVAVVSALQAPAFGRRALHFAARSLFSLTGMRVKVIAGNRLPVMPHLLLVNHSSYLDALVLYAALPPGAGYVFVAKREFVEQRFVHAFLRGLGTLFVDRHAASRGAEDVGDLVAALARGEKLVMFPEGTFTREAGLRPFRMGAFVAAGRAATPVLACGLRGTRGVLRDESWMPRHGHLEFEFGRPLEARGNGWESAARLRDLARAQMLALCGEHDLER